MQPPRDDTPVALYRFFGVGGDLLYIGITGHLPRRLHQHGKHKDWWQDCQRVEVEHVRGRDRALRREADLIKALRPRHNVTHNRGRDSTAIELDTSSSWSWRSVKSGLKREDDLVLVWEVDGDPITDEYNPLDATAYDLWVEWIRWLERFERSLESVPVYWFVLGQQSAVFEAAPFCDDARDDFLAHFTWPKSASGERLNRAALPVVDKLWRPGRADKGGFIQEITGWKPSAYQQTADVRTLARAARLYGGG